MERERAKKKKRICLAAKQIKYLWNEVERRNQIGDGIDDDDEQTFEIFFFFMIL